MGRLYLWRSGQGDDGSCLSFLFFFSFYFIISLVVMFLYCLRCHFKQFPTENSGREDESKN